MGWGSGRFGKEGLTVGRVQQVGEHRGREALVLDALPVAGVRCAFPLVVVVRHGHASVEVEEAIVRQPDGHFTASQREHVQCCKVQCRKVQLAPPCLPTVK